MQKADWFAVALTTLGIAATFLFGGPTAGIIFLILGIIFLVVWFRSQDSPARAVFDWSAEWKELAEKFERIPSKHVRATWISETLNFDGTDVGEQWYMGDDSNVTGAKEECGALCKLAGAMLLKSPVISGRLSEKVRTRSDDTWRWLYFLKEKVGLEHLGNGDTWAGGRHIKDQSGSIENLAAVSARICTECTAEELKQQ
ncbi:MAG: hypothetical protein HY233_09985 [Acidobacteriales bacterium]|nr:hypothetical protein [Terriglobales bacterium]